MVSYRHEQTTLGTYTYDGDGRRVMKNAGGVAAVFVYDALGKLAANSSHGAMSEGWGVERDPIPVGRPSAGVAAMSQKLAEGTRQLPRPEIIIATHPFCIHSVRRHPA